MNEPATGAIPPDRMRFDHGRVRTSASTTSTPC